MSIESNKTYVGVVEDNQDPSKDGRVKIRVMGVYDEIPLENIPWANPWKDLNGNNSNVPEKGKVVVVIFEGGNIDNPEFIYADHYNINLENKLKSLSDEDYTSMKSILFDHKTQIYVNDTEGLKIDYKYNNVNIVKDGIDVNLKDNNASLNLGDSISTQQAVLGNHFMEWMDKLLKAIQQGGLMNSAGPATPNPQLSKIITEFQSLKDIKFLSHHVNIVDNNKIKTVKESEREDEDQYGDKWTSTKEDNDITSKKGEEFKPYKGPKKEYDRPIGGQNNSDIPISGDELGSDEPLDNQEVNNGININGNIDGVNENSSIDPDGSIDSYENKIYNENIEIDDIIKTLKEKGYEVYDEVGILNMVAMRDKNDGVVTNKFDEELFVFYKDKSNEWILDKFKITTVPGLSTTDNNLPNNISILAYGQYINQCVLNVDNSSLLMKESVIHVNNNNQRYNYKSPTQRVNNYIEIRTNNKYVSSEYINDQSSGDQVFRNYREFNKFIDLCKEQNKTKSTFTYTVCKKSDFD